MPNETFLCNGRNQLALARKNRTSCKAAGAACKGTVLCIEQPFIRAEGAVKPERMIKACRLHFALKDGSAMGDQG